jgi:hypothetical protein
MATQFTPEDAAKWMLEELTATGYLAQYYAVAEIEARFRDAFVYLNGSGNPAISRKVLTAFTRITEDSVVWDRWDKSWHLRGPGDPATGRLIHHQSVHRPPPFR